MKSGVSFDASAHRRQATGFTLIEIVMVFMVLGILSAVAVSKYFDMRSKAEAEKCHYGRALLEKTLHERSSLEVNEVMSLTTAKFSTSINSAINEVMAELGGSGCHVGAHCEKLCSDPDSGFDMSYDQNGNGTYVFTARCSVHDPEDRRSGTQVGSQSNAKDLVKWLMGNGAGDNNYERALGEAGKSLDNFFTAFPDGEIDSEAMELKGYPSEYASLPALVKEALADSHLDMQGVVWNLSRNQLSEDPNYKYYNDGVYWYSQLVLTMADKVAPVDENNKVVTNVVKVTVKYPRGKGNNLTEFFDRVEETGTATMMKDSETGIVTLVPDKTK